MKKFTITFLFFSFLQTAAISQTPLSSNQDTGYKPDSEVSTQSSGPLFSFGVGHLSTRFERNWDLYDFGVGRYWSSGAIQFYLNFLISNSREYISGGWFDDKVKQNYYGFLPRLRVRVFKPIYLSFGFGALGANYNNERIGTSSDFYPLLSYSADIELPRIKKTGILLGVQFQRALKKGDHEDPNWDIFNVQATIFPNKYDIVGNVSGEEKLFNIGDNSGSIRLDEEQLFKNRKEKPNISLDFEFKVSQASQYYSTQLYSNLNDELLTGMLDLTGYVPIFDRLSGRFSFPFYGKLGLIESHLSGMPATDVETNSGVGDFSANLLFDFWTQNYHPLNISTDIGLILPTGESRFDAFYNGYLPLGNGFRMLTGGLNLSRNLSEKVMLFGTGGYALRFSREDDQNLYEEISPDDINSLKVGMGFLFKLFGQDKILNLEIERISVGKIIGHRYIEFYDDTIPTVVEPKLTVMRYGIRIFENLGKGHPAISYIGFQNIKELDNQDSIVISVTLPVRYNIFKLGF